MDKWGFQLRSPQPYANTLTVEPHWLSEEEHSLYVSLEESLTIFNGVYSLVKVHGTAQSYALLHLFLGISKAPLFSAENLALTDFSGI